MAISSRQEKMTLDPILKPINVTGLFPCSLASNTSASCFPASEALRVHTCQGLSMVPAAEMRTAGQAIAVIRPRVEIKSGTNIVKKEKVN